LTGSDAPRKKHVTFKKPCRGLKVDMGTGNTAEKRIRKHFSLSIKDKVTEKVVRKSILQNLPQGSSSEEVYSFLKKRKIGKDKLSSFYPLDEKGEIACRIEFDPESGYIVQEHYCVVFRMDERKKLKDIQLNTWYTGP
jgi:hypothetical protein